ncbi:uncharacterized protein LOC126797475 [Argentina anserina]|uniref:uncharacterized protein LOC126797475 n=1 Tax=Argentina anserina TaxID=57926 RepID=UPI0021766651|nr:uncharacterized protein LOC126797475 [Potentilla anserina]
MEKYESGEFEAGGYKWKLVLFPNGNKNHDVKDHISIYLEMGGKKAVKPGRSVTIDYKLFLLNQRKESYLVRENSNEEKKYCIYRTIVGGLAGFDRFIPLKEFSDASNGYLIDDTCEFGAEVKVSETNLVKGECWFSIVNPVTYKYVWKITNFSALDAPVHYSLPFTAHDNQKYCAWRLLLFPNGIHAGEGSHVSLYLGLHNPHELPPGSRILADYTLRILDQIHGNHRSFKVIGNWFDSSRNLGSHQMILQEENARFSKDGSCIIEVEFTIQGLSIPRVCHGFFKFFSEKQRRIWIF